MKKISWKLLARIVLCPALFFVPWRLAAEKTDSCKNSFTSKMPETYLSSELQSKDPKFEIDSLRTGRTVIRFYVIEHEKERKPIARLEFGVKSPNHISIINLGTEIRHQGVQTALFSYLLRYFPDVSVISSDLNFDNRNIVFVDLARKLGIVAPEVSSLDEFELGVWETQVLPLWEQLSENERKEMLYSSVELTPAMKTRRKFGFDKYCMGPPVLDPKRSVIVLIVCR